ncbi:hypothetical protein HSRCO_0428 [Halanaeroarchaeum sp. HSR-CO]|nr:hypothetical protein HSRCO_0428 [Halanaeroarchaeum sp. HSR-CO]
MIAIEDSRPLVPEYAAMSDSTDTLVSRIGATGQEGPKWRLSAAEPVDLSARGR